MMVRSLLSRLLRMRLMFERTYIYAAIKYAAIFHCGVETYERWKRSLSI